MQKDIFRRKGKSAPGSITIEEFMQQDKRALVEQFLASPSVLKLVYDALFVNRKQEGPVAQKDESVFTSLVEEDFTPRRVDPPKRKRPRRAISHRLGIMNGELVYHN